MNNYNKLLSTMDHALGFPNMTRSHFTKRYQVFDQRTGEHVIGLEYRVKVQPGSEVTTKDVRHRSAKYLPMIRELLALDPLSDIDPDAPRSTVELRKSAIKRKAQIANAKVLRRPVRK